MGVVCVDKPTPSSLYRSGPHRRVRDHDRAPNGHCLCNSMAEVLSSRRKHQGVDSAHDGTNILMFDVTHHRDSRALPGIGELRAAMLPVVGVLKMSDDNDMQWTLK